MLMPIIEGGGGGVPTPKRRKRNKAKSIESEICRRLGFPYYGFLLYHSGSKRLQNFLENHLTYLDQVVGSKFGVFTLVEKHKHPLKIDEILAKETIDQDLKNKIQKWREHTAPFTPDKCFEIAEAFGIPRKDIPCLIIFRSRNGYRGFARLKLDDSWFPTISGDDESLKHTMEWLAKLFDSLEKIMTKNKKDALADFQKRMDELARSHNIYRPIFKGIKAGLVPIIKLPFNIIASISSIVETVGTRMLENKLKLAKPDIE